MIRNTQQPQTVHRLAQSMEISTRRKIKSFTLKLKNKISKNMPNLIRSLLTKLLDQVTTTAIANNSKKSLTSLKMVTKIFALKNSIVKFGV
jgi:hypothetical protein